MILPTMIVRSKRKKIHPCSFAPQWSWEYIHTYIPPIRKRELLHVQLFSKDRAYGWICPDYSCLHDTIMVEEVLWFETIDCPYNRSNISCLSPFPQLRQPPFCFTNLLAYVIGYCRLLRSTVSVRTKSGCNPEWPSHVRCNEADLTKL
jgi:hypothetical protein